MVINLLNCMLLIALTVVFANMATKLDSILDKKTYKEALMGTKHPIITLTQNNKSYHFILDSGSAVNAIDKRYLEELEHTFMKGDGKVIGINGATETVSYCTIPFMFEDMKCTYGFAVKDFNGAFKPVEIANNKDICGIIGTDFMKKYNMKLDFSSGKMYVRKD